MLSPPALVERLEQERIAGRAELRSYLYQVATRPDPTAASLQVAVWLSRQHLAYTQKGLDAAIQKHVEDLDKLSTAELRERLRKAAGDL